MGQISLQCAEGLFNLYSEDSKAHRLSMGCTHISDCEIGIAKHFTTAPNSVVLGFFRVSSVPLSVPLSFFSAHTRPFKGETSGTSQGGMKGDLLT